MPTARPRVPALLSDPSLTGIPRAYLASLIERLSVHQAAQAERRLYHRRGGERLPGARGGVWVDLQQFGEHLLGAVLALIDQGEHNAVGVGEQRAQASSWGVAASAPA